jgi:DHA2 family multidrug resistance protein
VPNPVLRATLPHRFSPALNVEITRQAQMVADVDDFRLMFVRGLACAPLLLLLRLPRDRVASTIFETSIE